MAILASVWGTPAFTCIYSCVLYREELLWFYQKGASFLFPDYWEKFLAAIPPVERGDLMSAYYRRLTGDDKEVSASSV